MGTSAGRGKRFILIIIKKLKEGVVIMLKKRISIIMLAAAFTIITVLSVCGKKTENEGAAEPTVQPTTAQTAAPTAEPTPIAVEEPVEIKLVADASAFSEPMFKALFDGFAKAFPNITLKTEVAQGINDKLAVYVASGDVPDIYYGGLPNLPELRAQGKIMDFNEFFGTKAYDFDGTVKDSLTTGSDEAALVEGKRWGVPVGPGFTGIVVNDKMFRDNGWKVPTNWEELQNVSKQNKAKGIIPMAFGSLGQENRMETGSMASAIYQNGGDQLVADLDNLVPGAWNSPAIVESFKMQKELIDNGIISKDGLGMDPPQSQVAFLQGKYAMVFSGFWFEMEMKDSMTPETKIGMIPFPANLDANGKQTLFSWYNSVSAWAGTKHKEEAFEFIKYILSYQFQKTLGTKGGLTLLSNKKALAEIGEMDNISYFTKSVIKATTQENIELIDQKYMWWYPEQMRVPLGNAIKAILNGEYTPEEAAAFMEETATKLRNDTSIKKYKR